MTTTRLDKLRVTVASGPEMGFPCTKAQKRLMLCARVVPSGALGTLARTRPDSSVTVTGDET
jgi:hypothetical protein